MMQPELDKLRNMTEGYLNVVFIDVNHDRSAASRYRIRLIPTQVFYSPEGTELARHEGYFDAEGMLGVYQEKGFLRDVGGN
jgi:thioredoxin 1